LACGTKVLGAEAAAVFHVVKDIELPKDWREYRLPSALQMRLSALLDRQDCDGRLSPIDRAEAKALAELVDVLALFKAYAQIRPID
jgi:hypothetical protein